jgi:hypothetical protein
MTQRRRKKKSLLLVRRPIAVRPRFLGRSIMTRQLFFAITIIGTALLLNSPGEAQVWSCEDKNANCFGRGTDKSGGAGDWLGHQS